MHSSRMRTARSLLYGEGVSLTMTPSDRDPLDRDPPGQRLLPDRDPPDRDPPGQRPPWTETPLDRDPPIM